MGVGVCRAIASANVCVSVCLGVSLSVSVKFLCKRSSRHERPVAFFYILLKQLSFSGRPSKYCSKVIFVCGVWRVVCVCVFACERWRICADWSIEPTPYDKKAGMLSVFFFSHYSTFWSLIPHGSSISFLFLNPPQNNSQNEPDYTFSFFVLNYYHVYAKVSFQNVQ